MTSYDITPDPGGATIRISGVGDRQPQRLEAFEECQQGRCSCPTDEYRKVEAMDVEAMDVVPGEDSLAIRLRATPGTTFDTGEISTCLDYTVEKTGR